MHFVFGNELIISAVDGIEVRLSPGKMDLDVKHFWLLYKGTESIWPLGGWVNIVTEHLTEHIQNSFPFLSLVLLGMTLPLLCGIPLTRSPWIKILINLSVSLSSNSWKGTEEGTEEMRGRWYMGSWDAPKSTAEGTTSWYCC